MKYKIRYCLWVCNSFFPWKKDINTPEKAVVILPYFSLERIKHAKYMVRSLLRCNFVREIIATSHNPELDIFKWVHIRDPRLKLINNNETKKGPGYRWFIANTVDSDYFLVIDDDFLIFPGQLATLFRFLIEGPDIPHGVSGKLVIDGKFYTRKNMEVEILSQIFAVTRKHIEKYMEIIDIIKTNRPDIYPSIEEIADDIVISRAGKQKPRIHDVGYNLRCKTASKKGVALNQNKSFWPKRLAFKRVLDDICNI